MIEMRWKEILSKVKHLGSRPVVRTVLQYRQQVDKSIVLGYTPEGDNTSSPPLLVWSEWKDVPTVQIVSE